MPGLLDTLFGTPEQTQALGLLGYGASQRNIPGGFAAGMQYMAGAPERALKQQYMKAQADNLQSEVEKRKADMLRAEEESKFGMGLFTGNGLPGATPAAPGVPAAFGAQGGASAGGAPDLNTPMGRSWLGSLSGQQVLGLMKLGKLPAGAEKIWEIEKFGKDYKQGDFRIMPDGSQSMVPMVKEGLGYGAGGVSVLPGAAESQQQLTLANKLAEAAAASAGRVNLRPNADGTQTPVPELSENPLLQNYLSGGRQMVPQQRPMVSPNAQRGADAESIRMIQSELQNPNIPPEQRAGMQRELARLTQAQSQPGFPAPSLIRNPQGYGKTTAQEISDAATKEGALSGARLPAQATDKVNETWLKTSYEPAVTAGNAAQDMLTNVQVARQSMRNMGGTGWGTEAKAVGASILTGLGIAPQNAKLYAANSETFQNAAMSNLQTVLNAAKGPQTEGDASRASKTFAQLKNTPQANEFILDVSEAKAQREQLRARFFQEALPVARQKGDLQEVEREWLKRAPSIFSMPSMRRWAEGIK